MNDIKQIFLDLDGPLLDGKERHYACYQSILDQFGFKPVGIEEYWEMKRAMVSRRELLKLSGAEAIYDGFFAAWLNMIESPEMLALDKVQEGAIDCLCGWHQHGIELVLVTMRKNRQAVEGQLTRLKLRPLLDAVLVCDHAGGGKGKSESVLNLYQGKLDIEHSLWIGDTEADWEAAQSLGCDVVLLSNGLRSEAYLRTLKGAVVKPSIASLMESILEKLNVS